MHGEKPLLVYPLGDLDDDPASLLTFIGNLPVPAQASGHGHRRARAVIAFFELDTREDLLEERAKWIQALWIALRLRATGDAADRSTADQAISLYTSPAAPHSRCASAFRKLADSDPGEARAIAERMSAYLASKGLS
jgi:hypothetical protein